MYGDSPIQDSFIKMSQVDNFTIFVVQNMHMGVSW